MSNLELLYMLADCKEKQGQEDWRKDMCDQLWTPWDDADNGFIQQGADELAQDPTYITDTCTSPWHWAEVLDKSWEVIRWSNN